MKRLSGFLVALLLCGALVGGCGDSGGGTDFAAVQQALEECSQESLTGLLQVFYGLIMVPDVLQGEAPLPGFDVFVQLSVDPLDPPNTYDFRVAFDTNANAIQDTSIVGKVTFSEDPTDGLAPGATVQFDFTVQGGDLASDGETGTITGSGDILATVGAITEQVAITGTVSISDTAGDGCTADLTFPLAAPINLFFFDDTSGELAANVGAFDVFGTIQAIIESLGYTLDATLTLVADDETVNVAGDIDGTDVDFDFEILPSEAVIEGLFECGFLTFEWLEFFQDSYDAVIAAVLGGTPPPGLIVTPTANPNVFAYSVDLAAFAPGIFTGGMITGQATLVFPLTQLSGTVLPREAQFTWTIAGATFPSGDVTSGQNLTGRPFRVILDGLGRPVEFSGAGTLAITAAPPLAGISPSMSCVVTFDIPAGDPIAVDESDGTVLITVTIGEDVMTLVVDLDAEEVSVTINGVPFPFFGF